MRLDEALIKNARVLVCGDFIIDHYVKGVVERISPEAPVPVLKKTSSSFKLGGAANVAVNCSSLGAKTHLLAVSGPPSQDYSLTDLFESAGLSTDHVVVDPSIRPIVKTRFMADGHHILRVDEEQIPKFSPKLISILIQKFEKLVHESDVVVFSDYAKGFFDPTILFEFMKIARHFNKKVLVDPKGIHYAKYRGCFCIKPNKSEAYKAANCDLSTPIEKVSQILLDTVESDYLLITRSAEGMTLFENGVRAKHFAAVKQDIVDVVGAGDTALALLAVALAAQVSIEEAVILANAGSSIVIAKQGCASVTFDELQDRLLSYQKGFCIQSMDPI